MIDTDHYRRVEEGLKYVAWRNNTFSLHVHVGVRGADRAIAVCDRLRPVLPELLALSANSVFLDGRDSGLQSVRARSSPRASRAAGSRSRSAAWRPGPTTWTCWCAPTRSSSTPSCGGASAPITRSARWRSGSATAQSSAEDSTALAGLIVACVAQAAADHDEGVPYTDPPGRLIEENFWRAIRYGLDGRMIDTRARWRSSRPTPSATA